MIKSEIKSQKSKFFKLFETAAWNERGQSLIEALAALVVAIIVIVALIGLGVASMRSANLAKNNSTAAKIANREMEIVLSLADDDWTEFSNYGEGTHYINYGGGGISVESGSTTDDIFTRQFEISNVNADEKEITVTVTFTTSSGDHNTILRTYVTNWH